MADPPHETVTLHHPEYGDVEIDCGLAELIGFVWRAGLETVACCEEVRGPFAFIQFATPESAAAFLSTAAGTYSEDPESLYNRIADAHRLIEINGTDWRAWIRERCWHVDPTRRTRTTTRAAKPKTRPTCFRPR